MVKKILLWSIIIILAGAGLFALGRLVVNSEPPPGPSAYSLSPGITSMLGGGAVYMFDYTTASSRPLEELDAAVQRFLDRLGISDLAVAQFREFQFAYQVEIIEQGTGRHAFGLMLGKESADISPKAGPNVFWNTKYGPLIAEIGGGYGMVGRLLSQDDIPEEMPVTEGKARLLATEAITTLDANLSLEEEADVFYGFYEFQVKQNGFLVGELDVNGFSGQVWYKDWGEPLIDSQTLIEP